jgi:VanZ family protein
MPIDGTGDLPLFEGFDKLVHLGFFFVLTVLLFYGKIRQQLSYSYRIITILKILLITVILGGGIELLQLTVFTYRSAEWWDFFCDMTGVAMGIFSYILLHRFRFNEKLV